jgi:hypothetical protein
MTVAVRTGEPRAVFESMLGAMGIPTPTYTLDDYESDKKTSEQLPRK